ncbi:MAG: glutamate synthase subunit alpha, partial [Actinobacteria bacterium]|nr:glutamate synthase subunit alpha [Actinomycetota bacterium]
MGGNDVGFSTFPAAQGLYDPANEHDACGVAFVATMTGIPSHDIVDKALTALRNLDHRGASGAEIDTGDGAGILVQVPDEFLRAVVDFELPGAGEYVVGTAFLPQAEDEVVVAQQVIAAVVEQEGMTLLGWRDLPTTDGLVGQMAASAMPVFKQLFLTASDDEGNAITGLPLERLAYCVRKRVERETAVYFPSLSSRTLGYKGMLTTGQLEPFYPDLSDPRFTSALALVHSRFSTNTFPSWPLAHPFRFIAHNGEINTVKGNRNWMTAREAMLSSELIPGDLERLYPICTPAGSDSASFDEVLELLYLGGRSLPHAVLMMIPEAWENNMSMDPARRAFYEYHSTLMEPWDGPASVSFTDGDLMGAVLDRNGLRPGRFWITNDGLVVLGSEAGVLDFDPATVVRKGRLQPGRMFLVDTKNGRVIENGEIKAELASAHPYQEWLDEGLLHLEDLPDREHVVHTHTSVLRRQQAFGYTEEELRILLTPMAATGAEPIGSMGTDTPIAALSSRPRLIFDYFAQLFAQVTNPPLDALREEIVTSLSTTIGPEGNLLSVSEDHCRNIVLSFPVIDNDELAKILHVDEDGDSHYASAKVSMLYRVEDGAAGLERRLAEICAEIDRLVETGVNFIVLSDRDSDADFAPIPSLLATAAAHHHLVRNKKRTQVSLMVESGDVREVHHVALLIGYGAAAVNPYLAMETVEDMVRNGIITGVDPEQAVRNLVRALGKGVLKVMSKMGISTVASYRGAQVFEAIGLSEEVIDRYFTGTTSKLGGVGLEVLAEEVAARHRVAYPPNGIPPAHRTLSMGGEYQWRREGEPHLFNPETVFRLQHATRAKRFDIFREYSEAVNDQSRQLMTLRGLFDLDTQARLSIPIEEVEPISEIVKRFSTGAMS